MRRFPVLAFISVLLFGFTRAPARGEKPYDGLTVPRHTALRCDASAAAHAAKATESNQRA